MSRFSQQPAEGLKEQVERDAINLLVRDPHCLYVYWDMSGSRMDMIRSALGTELFNKSVPVLRVTNVTKHESLFIRINDFSTDWYINVPDPDSTYIVELGRKLSNGFFLSILSSNSIVTPAENISGDTTAWFANYNHVREGKYELIPDRKHRPGCMIKDGVDISGVSSIEFLMKG